MKTEAETRKEVIDAKLLSAGWDVNNCTQVSQEFDIPLAEGVCDPCAPYGGRQCCDYVLLGKDAKPLAVVEAKKSSKDPEKASDRKERFFFVPKDEIVKENYDLSMSKYKESGVTMERHRSI